MYRLHFGIYFGRNYKISGQFQSYSTVVFHVHLNSQCPPLTCDYNTTSKIDFTSKRGHEKYKLLNASSM